MRSQLEEVEKENRLAAVLHKTYVDQIEREKKKLIEDTRKHSSSNSSHAVSVNEHHSHNIEE